jgi:hypothetical protein
MINQKTLTLLGAAVFAASLSSQAATIVAGYSIDDTAGLTANTLAADVEATDLSSPDWTLAIANDSFLNIPENGGMEDGDGDNLAGAFTSGQFLEFTISATSGSFELYELQLTLERASQGPLDWGLRISDDGFAAGYSDTGIDGFNLFFDEDLSESSELKTVSLSGLTLDASTEYTFRIAMDDRVNNTTGNSAGRFYDIAVTAVPEPGTYALLLGCIALTSVMIRRRA